MSVRRPADVPRIRCISCGKVLRVQPERVGHAIRCPFCRSKFKAHPDALLNPAPVSAAVAANALDVPPLPDGDADGDGNDVLPSDDTSALLAPDRRTTRRPGLSLGVKVGVGVAGAVSLLVLALVVVLVVRRHAGPTLQEFSSAEGRFRVYLPGTPTTEQLPRDTPAGRGTFHRVYAPLKRMNEVYQVGYADYPQLPQGPAARQILASSRDGAVRAVNGQLAFQREITVNGHPGIEFEAVQPDKGYRLAARLILVGPRLYQLLVLGPEVRRDLGRVEEFFTRFELTAPP